MPGLSWYYRRLATMSPAEIMHRTQRALRNRAEATGLIPAPILARGPGEIRRDALPTILPPPGGDVTRYRQAALLAMNGTGRLLGLQSARFGPEFGWNRDPKTGISAPEVYGKTIDYRDDSLVGDIKYLWEPNRHLHLPVLGQAAVLTDDKVFGKAIERHLSSWWKQCPYKIGPNWSSALEAGLRLINWSWTWRILGGGDALRSRWEWEPASVALWAQSALEHMHFCATSYSKFSSANNHLIGEAAGVFVGSHTWPLDRRTGKWRAWAKAVLERECLRQYAADGVNLEQATSYQLFSFELLACAGIVGEQSGDRFSAAYWQRLADCIAFVASLYSTRDGLPQIGDSDDAVVFPVGPGDTNAQVESDFHLAGVLFDRDDWRRVGKRGEERSRWLLGGLTGPILKSRPPCPVKPQSDFAAIQSFPIGGYQLLHASGASGVRVKALVDTGPLGYLSIAAHGHADALAILLWIDDFEFLVDPGTYTYHTEPQWRAYFRGTSAHNTITIDRSDQSIPTGNFMWSRHAQAELLSADADARRAVVSARHHGYGRLADPVMHLRTVRLDAAQEEVVVIDDLQCAGDHEFDLRWHIHESCLVRVDGDHVALSREGRRVLLQCDGPHGGATLLRGSMEPLAGWISRRFGVREICPTLSYTGRFRGGTRLVTRLRLQREQ